MRAQTLFEILKRPYQAQKIVTLPNKKTSNGAMVDVPKTSYPDQKTSEMERMD